jgi:hypothetical protein
MDTTEITALIGAASALAGVGLKIAYDSLRERGRSRQARTNRFLDERKRAYDAFWSAHMDVTREGELLRELALTARAGRSVKDEVLETFPPSSMPKLVDALDTLRRIALTSGVVMICERMVALHGDARAALRQLYENPGHRYGLPWFLASRLREDQEREFVLAYRQDLGLGPPIGSPPDWPVAERPFKPAEAEVILHHHLRHSQGVEAINGVPVGELSDKDAKVLDNPRIKAMLADDTPS